MAEMEIVKREPHALPPGAEKIWLKLDGDLYSCLLSQDEIAPGDKRWHISVAKNDDLEKQRHDVPLWRNFVTIVHFLRPGVHFAIPVPPANQWMNLNPQVLHAHELKDPPLIEQMRINAEAVKGTPAAFPS